MHNPFYVPEQYPRMKMVHGDAAFRYDGFRKPGIEWEYSRGAPHGRDYSNWPAFHSTVGVNTRIEDAGKETIIFLFSSRKVKR